MLLPELFLASRAGVTEYNSGIDSFKECRDKAHYLEYPHQISYQFNSRGFRDREWPSDLHLQKVWDKLDSLELGQMLSIKTVAPKLPDLWVKCAKMYHDCFKSIEFNSDYSVVRRIK